MTRYVVLHHVLSDRSHWDLMIEHGPTLATWRLEHDPAELLPRGSEAQTPALKIADHRKHYLTYEGPVSGGRGSVHRLDEGWATVLEEEPYGWVVRMAGRIFCGLYALPGGDMPGTLKWLEQPHDALPG